MLWKNKSQNTVNNKYRCIFEAVLRELKTHPHSLARHAREVFIENQSNSRYRGVFFAKSDSGSSSPCIATHDEQTVSFASASSSC